MMALDSSQQTFQNFINLHKQQLITSEIPKHFWDSLLHKLRHEQFDAGNYFKIIEIQNSVTDNNELKLNRKWKVIVNHEDGINVENPQNIFLIDHAWTYRLDMARDHLSNIPKLLERMSSLMDIESGPDKNVQIEKVLREMWRYNQSYSVHGLDATVESKLPIWYIMDEFGAKIQHSDNPTFRTVPFYYAFDGITYTLLYPLKNVEFGDDVTRNFIEGPEKDETVQMALKIPWEYSVMTNVDYHVYDSQEDFYSSFRQNETLPSSGEECHSLPRERRIKVYSEYDVLTSNLKHAAFILTDDEDEADILWHGNHFKNFRELSQNSRHKFINQFPYESVLTIKDLLSDVCRRRRSDEKLNEPLSDLESNPKWFPTTYNLKTELPQFVSLFQHREERGLDNHWICKPWNLARGLDMCITNNLNCIVRLPSTGPKIASKYIENPVLVNLEEIEGGGVKFDLRYIVLLLSVSPLRLYVYDKFWVRFANKPFSLDHLDDYEKHFTVMNYRPTKLKQMFCHDFIKLFEEQHADYDYDDVQKSIDACLKEVFEAACSLPPPRGLGKCSQSRAIYGVDIMLKWNILPDGKKHIQPTLLEINWAPDCQRACNYYPEFFDDVFSVLFLDETEGKHVRRL